MISFGKESLILMGKITSAKNSTIKFQFLKSIDVENVDPRFLNFMWAYFHEVAFWVDKFKLQDDVTRCSCNYWSKFWRNCSKMHANRFISKFPDATGASYLNSDYGKFTIPVSAIKLNPKTEFYDETFDLSMPKPKSKKNCYLLKAILPHMTHHEVAGHKFSSQDKNYTWTTYINTELHLSSRILITVTDYGDTLKLHYYKPLN